MTSPYNGQTQQFYGYSQPVQGSNVQVNPARTSNVNIQNVQRSSNVQQVVTSQPISNPQQTSQFKGSRAGEVVSNDKRFVSYNHANEYKYNLFSLIDEPWNRCLQIGKCGSCPGNECITKQIRRGVWNWN